MTKPNHSQKDSWDKESLYQHLADAIAVEMYTIPLYLTAAYSIKPAQRGTWTVTVKGEDSSKNPISESFPVFSTVLSVAIQEMYHLMWACNVAKSVGMTIEVPAPDMSQLPGPLNIPSGITYSGVDNLANVIDLLVAIETPDPNYNYPVDPSDPITDLPGPTTPQDSYDSIGDLYHALAYGLNELFASLHSDDYNAYQKDVVVGTYPGVPKVTDLNSALNAIGAICEQGEGSGVDGFIPGAYQPKEGDYQAEDAYSHYERFVAIQKEIATLKEAGTLDTYLYSSPTDNDSSEYNEQLIVSYNTLLKSINNSYTYASSVLGTVGMDQISVELNNLWANGIRPDWKADPDAAQLPILELHVCQGLNACAGYGVNGSGTMPGDGDCATVNHTCVGSNNCRGQGACGYPGKSKACDGTATFTPGQNGCSQLGGCQAPISAWQVFDGGTSPNTESVWTKARSLFEARMQSLNMSYGVPSTTPSAIRQKKGTNPGSAIGDNSSATSWTADCSGN